MQARLGFVGGLLVLVLIALGVRTHRRGIVAMRPLERDSTSARGAEAASTVSDSTPTRSAVAPSPAAVESGSARTLAFRVVSSAGAVPVRDARLCVGKDGDQRTLGTSGSDGALEWTPEDGDESLFKQVLRFQADGYLETVLDVAAWKDSAADPTVVTLVPVAALVVRLVGASARTAGNKTVVIFKASAGVMSSISESGFTMEVSADPFAGTRPRVQPGRGWWYAASDEAGIASFEGLPAMEPLLLTVQSRPPFEAATLVLKPGLNPPQTVWLPAEAHLRGTVLEAATGSPVSGRTLNAFWAGTGVPAQDGQVTERDPESRPDAAARTDDGGAFEIEGVSPGVWYLGLAAEPSAPRKAAAHALSPTLHRIVVGDAGVDDLVIRVEPGTFVAGLVVDESGAPVPGVALSYHPDEVSAGSFAGKSGLDGAFTIGPVPDGPGAILATGPEGYAESQPVRANAGDATVVVTLLASNDLLVSLVGDDATPIPIERVVVSRDGNLLSIHQPQPMIIQGDSQGVTTVRPSSVASVEPVRVGRLSADHVDLFVVGQGGLVGQARALAPEPGQPRVTTLPARPGASVVIENLTDRRTTVRVTSRAVLIESDTLRPGEVWRRTVPAGPIEVQTAPPVSIQTFANVQPGSE